jgi:transcriptional regulator with XRE-family HTH domain
MLQSSSRFRCINSAKLRAIRLQLGWSQAELAKASGYSERSIRKAEKGGSLNLDTINDLAETFLKYGVEVSADELMLDIVSIARSFVESYDALGVRMLDVCESQLSSDFEFNRNNTFNASELAGTKPISNWVGLEGFRTFLHLFFRVYKRKPNSLTPVYLSNSDRVAVRYDETLYYQGHKLPTMWVNLHFFFRGSLICQIDSEFNHLEIARELERINKSS